MLDQKTMMEIRELRGERLGVREIARALNLSRIAVWRALPLSPRQEGRLASATRPSCVSRGGQTTDDLDYLSSLC